MTPGTRAAGALLALLFALASAVAVIAGSAAPPRRSYTLNGSRPSSFPAYDCGGALGVCLRMPIERVRQTLGIEDTRAPLGDGGIDSGWTLGRPPVPLTVFSDRVGSVEFFLLNLDERKLASVRIALPGGFTLGGSTLADVARKLGKPLRRSREYGEGNVVCSYRYYLGGEGGNLVTFDVFTTAGSRRDPRGFNAKLLATPINQFTSCTVGTADCF